MSDRSVVRFPNSPRGLFGKICCGWESEKRRGVLGCQWPWAESGQMIWKSLGRNSNRPHCRPSSGVWLMNEKTRSQAIATQSSVGTVRVL